ncbi:MAG: hypothetical protein EAZ40_15595 [Rhodobacterales bacterium]|nr:MAG: hypothetical protein EAZ40_15595 [Rhodobacterales bacterium]
MGHGSSCQRPDHASRQRCNTEGPPAILFDSWPEGSQATLAQPSRELGINPKTVAKWRRCRTNANPSRFALIQRPVRRQEGSATG